MLGDACACMNVLLVLDDVWELKHAQALHFLDRGTASKLLITTRLKGVFPGASEFELGVLDRDDAAALMLECGGESHGAPPYSDHVYVRRTIRYLIEYMELERMMVVYERLFVKVHIVH